METDYDQYQISNKDLNADKIHGFEGVQTNDYQTLTLKTEILQGLF